MTVDAREATEEEPRLDGPELFVDRIGAEFAYALRHGAPLTLLVVEEPSDLDDARAPSDRQWRAAFRSSDFVARIDERRVAVIAPNTPARTADAIASRLRAMKVRGLRVGLVTLGPSNPFEGPGAMLRAAELALE